MPGYEYMKNLYYSAHHSIKLKKHLSLNYFVSKTFVYENNKSNSNTFQLRAVNSKLIYLRRI